VLKQVIKVNGVTHEGTKIAYFQWMLRNTTLTWGDNFVDSTTLIILIMSFAQALCKRYCKVQMDEQVYMTLRTIKQNLNERVEKYYK
jgi:hypothetical protein